MVVSSDRRPAHNMKLKPTKQPVTQIAIAICAPERLRGLTWCYVPRVLFLLSFVALAHTGNSYGEESIPDPLAAGWKGQSVCESLHEDSANRVLRCTFAPGVGHERHYHVPHFAYIVAGGVMQMTDESGTYDVEVPTAEGYLDPGTDWHEGVNVGDTTIVILMVEPKNDGT